MMNTTGLKKTWKAGLVLLCLWTVCTAYNITKPYHIDDAAHLEIAKWIVQNPLHPMSGLVNSGDCPEPIHKLNQPHLYFYLLALYIKFFGETELSTHLFQSGFVLVGIFFFFKLAQIHVRDKALLLSFFLVFCPAFLVEQNLMVDIPLASIWIAFYYVLSTDTITSASKRYLAANLLASAAILMKYTSLPLIPAIFFTMFLRRDLRHFFIGFIPFAALALWSLFNYLDYGSMHILDRPQREFFWSHLGDASVSWIITLGSIGTASIAFVSGYCEKSKSRYRLAGSLMLSVGLLCIVSLIVLFYLGLVEETLTNKLLRVAFLANGLVLLALVLICTAVRQTRIPAGKMRCSEMLLLYWILSSMAFVVLFAPFMATRHVLLAIPPILILLGKNFLSHARKTFLVAGIFVSVGITVLLGISDWSYADFYRRYASRIAEDLSQQGEIWFAGHWGWQWYAKLNGMKEIDGRRLLSLKPGDLIVYPYKVDRQKIDGAISADLVAEYWDDRRPYEYVSTSGWARFYYANSRRVPWNLSRSPFDKIGVYRVKSIQATWGQQGGG